MQEYDTGIKDFIRTVYTSPLQEPGAFQLTLPEGIEIKEFLAYFISFGAQELFGKEQLAFLTPEEIEKLRAYLRSIGWDVEWKVETRTQTFETDDGKTNERQVNYFSIDFFPTKMN